MKLNARRTVKEAKLMKTSILRSKWSLKEAKDTSL